MTNSYLTYKFKQLLQRLMFSLSDQSAGGGLVGLHLSVHVILYLKIKMQLQIYVQI